MVCLKPQNYEIFEILPMYENVKKTLIDKGYKKYNASSLLYVRDDMLFTLSPQGVKQDINIWFAIYPLALPNLWINMGWRPAAGSFPKDGRFPYDIELTEALMIQELEQKVFPFFDECKTLFNLEQLYEQGNRKAQYPRVFTLFSMKEYEKANSLANELINEFRTGGLGVLEMNLLEKFSLLKSLGEVDAALEDERKKNIKKYNLARHIKNAKKYPMY